MYRVVKEARRRAQERTRGGLRLGKLEYLAIPELEESHMTVRATRSQAPSGRALSDGFHDHDEVESMLSCCSIFHAIEGAISIITPVDISNVPHSPHSWSYRALLQNEGTDPPPAHCFLFELPDVQRNANRTFYGPFKMNLG